MFNIIDNGLPCPFQVVEAVAEALQQHAMGCVVVDPVTVSTSGDALATQVGATC